ncbi:MAG: alpha-L-fucosidase [Bryobacterales bacterium]|nr:alpha-L-fucosidase [Bryobacterales bacterium]
MTKALCLLYLCLAVQLTAQTKYRGTWESVDKRPTPQWFQNDKFGIFIHWGVYSVPAYAPVGKYAEWYWNALSAGPQQNGKPNATFEFHNRVYGSNFDYSQFAPMFKCELYDPAQWADVFEKSGAKYVVLTSKHHDGFALWPSAEADRTWGRPWNAVSNGPRRDILGDLTSAVRARGLRMGYYYSLYEWYNPLWKQDRPQYVATHMTPQFKDLVNRYKPAIIFSDGEWDMPSENWKSAELLAWLFNESPVAQDVVVNDRWGKETRHHHGGYYTTEYTAGLEGSNHPWEESRGMGFSYGYNRAEQLKDYRTSRELVLMLVDLVSRGGNLLLDIGPTGDGRIPVIMQQRLIEIGAWLKRNGDAIYGTRPFTRTRQWSAGDQLKLETGEYMKRYEVMDYVERKKEGQAVIEAFFTAKGKDLYAIVPNWPASSKLTLRDVGKPSAVELLGTGPVKWTARGRDIVIDLPAPAAVHSHPAFAIKLSSPQQ